MPPALANFSQLRAEILDMSWRHQAELVARVDKLISQVTFETTEDTGTLDMSQLTPADPGDAPLLPLKHPVGCVDGTSVLQDRIIFAPRDSADPTVQALWEAIATLDHCRAADDSLKKEQLPESCDPWHHETRTKEVTMCRSRRRMLDTIDKEIAPPVNDTEGCLRKMVSSAAYDITIMVFVSLSAAISGLQVQRAALHEDRPISSREKQFFDVCEYVFLAVFMIDVFLRIVVHKWGFYYSHDRRWNVFDGLLVFVMAVSAGLQAMADHVDGWLASILEQSAILRIVRIARIFKVLRLLRVVAAFRELRVMFQSLAGSFKSLLSVCVILLVILYVSGVAMVVGTLNYLDTVKWAKNDTESLQLYFGRLDNAVVALFEAMTGGISWGELLIAIEPLGAMYKFLFFAFIIFSLFGVVNIVTGVFVDSAFANSKNDQDMLIELEQAKEKALLTDLRRLFDEIDDNHSGSVTVNELVKSFEDERLSAYVTALGLHLDDVKCLFTLLDHDESGTVNKDEFISGCMRLQGEASNLEMAKLEFESKCLLDNTYRLRKELNAVKTLSESVVASVKILLHLNVLGRSSSVGGVLGFNGQRPEQPASFAEPSLPPLPVSRGGSPGAKANVRREATQ